MFVHSPEIITTINLADFETVAEWRRKRVKEALQFLDVAVEPGVLVESVTFIADATGIQMTPGDFREILRLYPVQRAHLARHGCQGDEAHEAILDVIANYFMASRWPCHQDWVGLEQFRQRLALAAELAGFEATPITGG